MTDLGWMGVALLIVCVVMIGVEGALAAFWARQLAKRAKLLSERLATEQFVIKTEMDHLQVELAATVVLWQPYGRALRWARHPLVIALLESYARRRMATR